MGLTAEKKNNASVHLNAKRSVSIRDGTGGIEQNKKKKLRKQEFTVDCLSFYTLNLLAFLFFFLSSNLSLTCSFSYQSFKESFQNIKVVVIHGIFFLYSSFVLEQEKREFFFLVARYVKI